MKETKPRSSGYVAILAAVSCVILVGGWLARPREIRQSPAPLPSETELEQLARRAERRALDDAAKYFSGVARDVEASLIRVASIPASGVAWDDHRIITAPLPGAFVPEVIPIAGASKDFSAQPHLWGPQLPISVFTRSRELPGPLPIHRTSAPPPAGGWVVAVWRNEAGPAFAAGHFRQSLSTVCGVTSVEEIDSSLSFNDTMVGGGVFDLDGLLVGMILPCGERIATIAAASIQSILDRQDTVEQRLLGRYGFRIDATAAEADYYKTAAAPLVREVWTGYAGDMSGVRPGDLIVGVDGHLVSALEDLQALSVTPTSVSELTVQRGPKTLKIDLRSEPSAAAATADVPTGAGMTWSASADPFRIDTVIPGGRAALAGIQAGDRVIRIDRAEPRGSDQVKRIFARNPPSPVLVEIERGRRRLAVLVR